MEEQLLKRVKLSIDRFVNWLEGYDEVSWDHQSFFAGPLGGKAKALYYKNPLIGTLAVAPMIFCEAFFPSARRLFWKPQRFPIADAQYAMGFAYLSCLKNDKKLLEKAVHFLNVLRETRSGGYQHYCWGYPFDWQTRNGVVPAGTPLITSVPYGYEAFLSVYQIDRDPKWLDIMHSISEHAMHDIRDFEIVPDEASCSYSPLGEWGVINASAYRAFLLTSASIQFPGERYWKTAERNVNFVLRNQQADGSWYYASDSIRDFIDHFHTCFVLKALGKIEQLTGHSGCRKAIEKGVEYYTKNLLDRKGLPRPFSKAPRIAVYKQELYDYAECINLCVLLRKRFGELDRVLHKVLEDLLGRWQKPDGSFRSRKLIFGWDNVPMHRWAQSQIFRSLSLLLYEEGKKQKEFSLKT